MSATRTKRIAVAHGANADLLNALIKKAHDVARVKNALAWRAQPVVPVTLLDRLAPRRTTLWLHQQRARGFPIAPPRGWVRLGAVGSAHTHLVPAWMAALVVAWHAPWALVIWLLRAGVLECEFNQPLHAARPRGWKAWWTPERARGWRWVLTGEWS
jgi:hypothetical protein